jgi:uncharacterized protein YkwD
VIATALSALLALTPAWGSSPPPTCPATRPLTVTTLCLINELRAAAGAPRLRLDPRLSRAARRHADDMVRKHYFSHTSPAGLAVSDRIARAGWMRGRKRWAVGETLAWWTGPARPGTIVRAWVRSPAHRKVMLRRRYHVVGIGIATGTPAAGPGRTYTADFGS